MVYSGKAICKFGANFSELNSFKATDLHAVTKYSHFLIETDSQQTGEDVCLNFENVPHGKSCTKFVTIINMLPVSTLESKFQDNIN